MYVTLDNTQVSDPNYPQITHAHASPGFLPSGWPPSAHQNEREERDLLRGWQKSTYNARGLGYNPRAIHPR